MQSVVIVLLLLSFFNSTSSENKNRQILPADSYQVLGKTGFRRLGVCNYTYAWLTPPPGSSLDVYGHALACTRLQLNNGRLVNVRSAEMTTVDQTTNHHRDESTTEFELKKVDKRLTATMVNLSRLDTLMRADEIDIEGNSVAAYPEKHHLKPDLADSNRFFYLADRIGNMNIMAVLRPGQTRSKFIKFEVIDPVSAEHALTPHHILCSRKQCSFVSSHKASKEMEQIIKIKNNTFQLTAALSKAEKHSQSIYMQLIVSRVTCALLGLLCIVFAVTSLILCTRLHSCQARVRKSVPHSETAIICEPQSPASCYRINGIGSMGLSTTECFTDNPISQGGFMHLPSDTLSLKNAIMSTSSISACEGNYPGSMQYNSGIGIHGPLPPYPLGSNQSNRYGDMGARIALVPIPSRASIVSNSRSILFPYQTEATSPIPSVHTQKESTSLIYRSESLGRSSKQRDCGRRRILLKPARQANCTRPAGQVGAAAHSDAVYTGSQCTFNQPTELATPHEWLSLNQFPKHAPLLQQVSDESSSTQQTLMIAQYPVLNSCTTSGIDRIELHNGSIPGIGKPSSPSG